MNRRSKTFLLIVLLGFVLALYQLILGYFQNKPDKIIIGAIAMFASLCLFGYEVYLEMTRW
jgi:hypothetical protein